MKVIYFDDVWETSNPASEEDFIAKKANDPDAHVFVYRTREGLKVTENDDRSYFKYTEAKVLLIKRLEVYKPPKLLR